jgi:hypothetical protein
MSSTIADVRVVERRPINDYSLVDRAVLYDPLNRSNRITMRHVLDRYRLEDGVVYSVIFPFIPLELRQRADSRSAPRNNTAGLRGSYIYLGYANLKEACLKRNRAPGFYETASTARPEI